MKTSEYRKRELIGKIKEWLNEKPDCLWLQEAVAQLEQYEKASTN